MKFITRTLCHLLEPDSTFNVKYLKDEYFESSSDWKDGDWYCVFDNEGKELLLKKTKTFEAMRFIKNKMYCLKTDWQGYVVYISGENFLVERRGSKITRNPI